MRSKKTPIFVTFVPFSSQKGLPFHDAKGLRKRSVNTTRVITESCQLASCLFVTRTNLHGSVNF